MGITEMPRCPLCGGPTNYFEWSAYASCRRCFYGGSTYLWSAVQALVLTAIFMLVFAVSSYALMFRTVAATQLPAGRMAIVLGVRGESYLVSGLGAAGPSDLVWVFDSESRTWMVAGRLLRARLDAAAIALADGRILVTGGCCPVTKDVEVFDPASGRSQSAAGMRDPRSGHTLSRLADGRIAAVGGATPSRMASTNEVFTPSSGQWTDFPRSIATRTLHGALGLSRARLLAIGGIQRFEHGAGEWFDPLNDAWHKIAGYEHYLWPVLDVAEIKPDVVLLVEKEVRGGIAVHSYDLGTQQWTQRCRSAVPATIDQGAVILPGGNVLVVGGSEGPPGRQRAVARVELLDVATGTWRWLPDLRYPRANPHPVFVNSESVAVVGGYDGEALVTLPEFVAIPDPSTLQRTGTTCP